MLNWIALYFNNFILTLPGVKKPGSQASYEVADTAKLLFLGDWKKSEAGKEFIKSNAFWGDFLRTDLHWGILLALVVVLLAWYYLNHTTKGFELRAVGANKDAAEFAGIGVKKNMVMAMFISGGIAALAGAIQILGTNPFRISVLPVTEGYGWDGISVSLIANNNPLGCVLSGLLFSGLQVRGRLHPVGNRRAERDHQHYDRLHRLLRGAGLHLPDDRRTAQEKGWFTC